MMAFYTQPGIHLALLFPILFLTNFLRCMEQKDFGARLDQLPLEQIFINHNIINGLNHQINKTAYLSGIEALLMDQHIQLNLTHRCVKIASNEELFALRTNFEQFKREFYTQLNGYLVNDRITNEQHILGLSCISILNSILDGSLLFKGGIIGMNEKLATISMIMTSQQDQIIKAGNRLAAVTAKLSRYKKAFLGVSFSLIISLIAYATKYNDEEPSAQTYKETTR